MYFVFVLFAQGGGVAWGGGGVGGTRQSSSICGRGNHDIEVDGGGGGVESDIGAVEGVVVVVLVGGLWFGGHVVVHLFCEWLVAGGVEDELREAVTEGVVASVAERAVATG